MSARRFLWLILFALVSCAGKDVAIVYDNDVHCHIDGYTHFAALKDSLGELGYDVLLVSSGDFLSGGVYGNVTRGSCIKDYLKGIGYDAVTIGNHEFDFSVDTMTEILRDLPVVCCNFKKHNGESVYPGYRIVKAGSKRFAFIGVTTPTTLVTSTPSYFKDSTGRYIFSFCADSLSAVVQRNIDSARKNKADYVIILSHLGDTLNPIITSRRLIRQTYGADAVIDGHEHHVIKCDTVINSIGRPVILTSSGAFFRNTGVVTISKNGDVKSHLLLTETTGRNRKIDSIDLIVDSVFKEKYKYNIAYSRFDITIYDKNGYVTRNCETTLGDIAADAIRSVTGAQIAFINSGGLRSNFNNGDITFLDICNAMPFDNYVYKFTVTGEDILDMLEMASRIAPGANGGFIQVSGLKYSIDTSIISDISLDNSGIFDKVEGARRIHNVQVMTENGTYIPLVPEKIYTAASIEYIISEKGDGINIRSAKIVGGDFHSLTDVIRIYLSDTLKGQIPRKYLRPEGRINYCPRTSSK